METLKAAAEDVAGVTAPSASEPNGGEPGYQGLIAGVICATLLVLTLVGVAVFWIVCWRHQKDRLTKKIQMQFLYQNSLRYHQQMQQSGVPYPGMQGGIPSVVDSSFQTVEIHGIPNSTAYSMTVNEQQQASWSSPDGVVSATLRTSEADFSNQRPAQHGAEQIAPPPPYPASGKKKLYFSPEFLEPEHMVDPPPLAEEFLYEVRRMIDLAKTRLRAKRYVPRLNEIPEECGPGRDEPVGLKMDLAQFDPSIIIMDDLEGLMIIDEQDEDEIQVENAFLTPPASTPEKPDSPASSEKSAASPDSGKSGSTDRGGDSSHGSHGDDSGVGSEGDVNNQRTQEDKVSHWLDAQMPSETVEIEEGPVDGPAQQIDGKNTDGSGSVRPMVHSRLFRYFNARQRVVSATNKQQEQLEPASDETFTAGHTGTPPFEHSPNFAKRYRLNCASTTNDFWLQKSPKFISRQRIVSSHTGNIPNGTIYQTVDGNLCEPPIVGPSQFTPRPLQNVNGSAFNGVSGLHIGSLPRQFLRSKPSGMVFPSENKGANTLSDSLPVIHQKRARPRLNRVNYDNESFDQENNYVDGNRSDTESPVIMLHVSSQDGGS